MIGLVVVFIGGPMCRRAFVLSCGSGGQVLRVRLARSYLERLEVGEIGGKTGQQ